MIHLFCPPVTNKKPSAFLTGLECQVAEGVCAVLERLLCLKQD